VVISLQPHFDEGPEDDLQAHREFERGRCLPRQDPSPVQDDVRENEEDFRLIRDHHHSLPAQLTPDLAPYRTLKIYNLYLLYNLYTVCRESQARSQGALLRRRPIIASGRSSRRSARASVCGISEITQSELQKVVNLFDDGE
jgi:hypothetical protein